ncbi:MULTISPECIES: hypothetical protein [unclassified Serratia (in: enterobacteria)]|uniref:hypothetical protein n=1 Tax=unclassified Serratia (in: enterobacteria) TaxID=2647522 RepID=UPI000468DDBA|nr:MULTISPECIES: hypothetical protein [unclassified Serratia (in: enterobacteria)]
MIEFIKKFNIPFLSPASILILSISCAFVGNYTTATAWSNVKDAASLIAFILTNPYIGIVISAVLFIFSEMGNHVDKKELTNANKQLKIDNQELISLRKTINESQEACEGLKQEIYNVHLKQIKTWLKGICKQTGLSTYDRISIYFALDKEFSILSRYSLNPELCKIHKRNFPLDRGVLSHAWRYNEHWEGGSPTYDIGNPNQYYEYMEKEYGYSEESLNKINMKSCRYLGLSITDADENIGVILFESLKTDTLTAESISKIIKYCDDFQSHLCSFVKDSIIYDKALSLKQSSAANDNDAIALAELTKVKSGDNHG